MDEATLRRDLLTAWEYTYLHEDWVNPLDEALAGVTPKQALWPPSPEGKGIWEIVLHLAVWNENIVERIETGQNTHPKEGAWPPIPETPDDVAWESAKRRLNEAIDSVRVMLETVPWEKVEKSPYGLPDLLCRFIHNGYHLGQITKIREVLETAG